MPSPGEYEQRHEAAPEVAATAAETLAVVQDGIERYGSAFIAYLILDGVEQRALDLTDEFEQVYYGYWPDRTQFVEHQVEELGWQDALRDFERDNGLWPEELAWQPEVVFEHLSGLYRITERLGGVYVFRR